ncbi:hypothetical protein [Sphingobacterium hotanense]|uniref:hypothetical protein n=1 Tax=Sphingobacterium hotanense TaxID=649196 RepID=UPI0021A877B7|nr:hypothetical protein [Sphingobacterium hotanense]MCT1523886.1 hypothetical protein [Sphingobacterium hotanense]
MKTSIRCVIPIALFFFCVMICQAQNATLTKEETINYLNKKANEVVGHYRTIRDVSVAQNFTYYYTDNRVSLSGENLRFDQRRRNYKNDGYGDTTYPCDFVIQEHETILNPAHIVAIEHEVNVISGEPIGTLKITLVNNVAQRNINFFAPTKKVTNENHSHYGECHEIREFPQHRVSESVKVVYLSYLQSDPSNFNKLKKALEYLRDLMKAEDDPFGE